MIKVLSFKHLLVIRTQMWKMADLVWDFFSTFMEGSVLLGRVEAVQQ